MLHHGLLCRRPAVRALLRSRAARQVPAGRRDRPMLGGADLCAASCARSRRGPSATTRRSGSRAGWSPSWPRIRACSTGSPPRVPAAPRHGGGVVPNGIARDGKSRGPAYDLGRNRVARAVRRRRRAVSLRHQARRISRDSLSDFAVSNASCVWALKRPWGSRIEAGQRMPAVTGEVWVACVGHAEGAGEAGRAVGRTQPTRDERREWLRRVGGGVGNTGVGRWGGEWVWGAAASCRRSASARRPAPRR